MNSTEDRPVGGTNFSLSEYPDGYDPSKQSQEMNNLTIEQKFDSRVWKFRLEALQEIQTSKLYDNYQGTLIFLLQDNHQSVQEEAYKCFQNFLNEIQIINFDLLETVKKIIQKFPLKMKPSLESIFINLVEKSNKIDEILKGILWGLSLKIPKQVQISLYILSVLIQNYGSSYLGSLEIFWKELEAKALMANSSIAQESLNIYKQASHFMGPGIRSKLDNLKKSIQDEFDVYLQQNPQTKLPNRINFIKQQNFTEQKQIDLFDSTIAQDILSQFPENWLDQTLQIEKWNTKKETLDIMINAIKKTRKIAPKPMSPYITFLKRILQDSNINIVISGLKIIELLAERLRKHFGHCCKAILPLIILKMKDKKMLILTSVSLCLEQIFNYSMSFEDCELMVESLSDKSPILKVNILSFIQSLIKKISNPKLILHLSNFFTLEDVINVLLEDGAAEVRLQAQALLLQIQQTFGLEIVADWYQSMNPSLKQKIEKMFDKSLQEYLQQNRKSQTLQKQNKKIETISYGDSPESFLSEDLQIFFQKYDLLTTWEKKFTLLQNLRVDSIDEKIIFPFFTCLEIRFKNWREANINLNRELFRIFYILKERISSESFNVILPFLLQKLMETQFTQQVNEFLAFIMNKIPLKGIISQSLPLLKHSKQIQEFSELLMLALENKIPNFPFQLVMNYIKQSHKPIMPNVLKKILQLQPTLISQLPASLQEKLSNSQCKFIKLLQNENTLLKGLEDIKKQLNQIPQNDLQEIIEFIKKNIKLQKNKMIFKAFLSFIGILFEQQQGASLIPLVLSYICEKQILIKSEITNCLVVCGSFMPNELIQGILQLFKKESFTDRQELWTYIQTVNISTLQNDLLQDLLKEAYKDGVEIQGVQIPIQEENIQVQYNSYFNIEEQDIIQLQKNMIKNIGQSMTQGLFSYSQELLITNLNLLKTQPLASYANDIIPYLRVRVITNTNHNQIGLIIFDLISLMYPYVQNLTLPLIKQLLIISFELLGNYTINLDLQLQQIIQALLKFLPKVDAAHILVACYNRYQNGGKNLKNDLYYIMDTNYRDSVERGVMTIIDQDYQSEEMSKKIKIEHECINSDSDFYEYLLRMANEDFQQKNNTIQLLLKYQLFEVDQDKILLVISQMVRTCWTEQIHYVQNEFLNHLTEFILKFFHLCKNIDAQNLINDILINLLNHAQIKTAFSEDQTKNLNTIILGYLSSYPNQVYQQQQGKFLNNIQPFNLVQKSIYSLTFYLE